jgi:hypothetical protein
VVKRGGQLVPLVQDLGQAHVRQAQMGWLAAFAGPLQRLPVGGQRSIQVALGALHLAQVVADTHGQKASEEPCRKHCVSRKGIGERDNAQPPA